MQTAIFTSNLLIIATIIVGGFYLRHILGHELGAKDATIETLREKIGQLEHELGTLKEWQSPELLKKTSALNSALNDQIRENNTLRARLTAAGDLAGRAVEAMERVHFAEGLMEGVAAIDMVMDTVIDEIRGTENKIPSPAFMELAFKLRTEMWQTTESVLRGGQIKAVYFPARAARQAKLNAGVR